MRHSTSWRRSLVALTCVIALPGPIAIVAASAAEAKTPGQRAAQLKRDLHQLRTATADLRRQAKAARTALTVGTAKWKAAKKKLNAARKDAKSKAAQAKQAGRQVESQRRSVAQVAALAYQSPVDSSVVFVTGMGTGDPLSQARALADLDQITAQRAGSLGRFQAAKIAAEVFAGQARKAAAAARKQATALHKRTKRLRAQAKKSTAALSKSAAKVDALQAKVHKLRAAEKRREARIAAKRRAAERSRNRAGGGHSGGGGGGGGSSHCQKSSSLNYPNGLVPASALCPLPGGAQLLRADAARAFWRMNDAYRSRFGSNICVNAGYRSLRRQYQLYRIKPPGVAAVPGTSHHGLGIAVDLGCGINIYRSTRFNWMKRHAPRYGFAHPYWAEHNPFEPWHWEYTG